MLIENFATCSNAVRQKIETILKRARLSSAWRVFADQRFPFFSHPSVDRRFSSSSSLSPLHPRPLSRTDNDVHYFLLLQRAQGNGRSRGGCRGCSLAPRKIIRCRYAITTFASAKWKRFRFFAPASDGRWLRFSEPTIVFGFARRRWEKERDRSRLIGDKLYTLESHHKLSYLLSNVRSKRDEEIKREGAEKLIIRFTTLSPRVYVHISRIFVLALNTFYDSIFTSSSELSNESNRVTVLDLCHAWKISDLVS